MFVLAAEEDGRLSGYTIAESLPQSVNVLILEGDAAMCSLLLDRVLRLAGERDVTGWCPTDRPDMEEDFQGGSSYLFHCPRNNNL